MNVQTLIRMEEIVVKTWLFFQQIGTRTGSDLVWQDFRTSVWAVIFILTIFDSYMIFMPIGEYLLLYI